LRGKARDLLRRFAAWSIPHPHRLFILLLIALAFFLRLPLLRVRYFDPDELEHLHAAWCIYRGMLPYRDFFEHHTPLLHYVLAFLYPALGESIELIFAARALMWLLTGLILYLTFRLGSEMFDDDIGITAALLLSYMVMFLEKSLEIRPDVASTALWLLCLIVLIRAVRYQSRRLYLWSGISLGVALLFTPKILFPTLGVALGFAYQLARYRISPSRHLRFLSLFALGYLIPIAGTLIYFGVLRGADDFIRCNFLMNLRWKVRFSPLGYIKRWASQNPIFGALGLAGLLISLYGLRRREAIFRAWHIPSIATVFLVCSLWIIPVPSRQFYMTFLPLWAVYGARLLKEGIYIELGSMGKRRWAAIGAGAIVYLGFVIYALKLSGWVSFRPTAFGSGRAFLITWAGVIAACAVVSQLRFLEAGLRRGIALSLICLGITAYPLDQMKAQLNQRNDGQLRAIRYVMDITSPDDHVQDGWSGFGLFRPHSYYYWFLHGEIRAMLTEKQLTDDIISAMERVRTKVVIYDGDLRAMPEKFRRYVEANFEPTGVGNIWVRKPIRAGGSRGAP